MSGFKQDLRGAEAEVGGLGAKLQNALSFKSLLRTGAIFGLGTTLPGILRDLVGFAGDAAAHFRELEQTGLTVDQVFGDARDTIHQWGEDAAEAAGLSKREVSESAATMGLMLRNMGFDADSAADMVVKAQQRAADLAIGLGKDTGEAILGISALLRGEFDTIEKLGVRIKQADVNARVASLGLDTSTAKTKKYAEAVAALDLFFEQTEGSAGRFADQAETTAVKLEKSGAKWQNFVDTQFGPMVNSILDGAATVGLGFSDIAEGVGDWITDMGKVVSDPRVQQLADALGIPFNEAGDLIVDGMNDTGRRFDETVDGMLMSAYELGEGGAESFDHFTAAFTQMGQSVQGVASGVGDVVANAIPAAVLFHWDQIKQAGIDSMTAYNQGIFESQQSFADEIDGLLKALDEHLAPGEEIARLRGQKMALLLARGIHENDPAAVAAIDAMIEQINNRLNTLTGYLYGRNLMKTLADGIYAYSALPGDAAGYAAAKIRGQLQIKSEPPDPSSPLRGITKWGGNIVKTIADGIYGELGTGTAASRALAGALVPSMPGAGMAMAGSVGGGQTVQYILQVEGQAKVVGSREQVIDAWLQMNQSSDRGSI